MNVKGVFFDLFGTLLTHSDMSAAWSDWLSEFYICLKRHGLSIPKETFAECCDGFFTKEEPPNREDGLTIFERRIQALCSELEVSLTVVEINSTATAIFNAWQKHAFIDPDCHPVLEVLQQHKTLGLISNFDHPPYVRDMVSDLGLEEFFTTVVISGDVGIKKPDPRIFHLALQRTGLHPQEVVHVGDAREDVLGARAAGILPILLQRDVTGNKDEVSDFRTNPKAPSEADTMTDVVTINSLPELIKFLE